MDDLDFLDIGPCCSCGARGRDVHNLVQFDFRNPFSGPPGWGCVQCGLPAEGAVAALCDACLDRTHCDPELIPNILGPDKSLIPTPAPDQRTRHDHDLTRHPEEMMLLP